MKALFGSVLVAAAVGLTGCGSSSIPAAWRSACLESTSTAGPLPIEGYPASVLADAWRKRGGAVRMDGSSVIELTSADALTKTTHVFRLEVQPGKAIYHSDRCGPDALLVSRMSADGEMATGYDLYEALGTMAKGAAQTVGLGQPTMTSTTPPSASPRTAAAAPTQPATSTSPTQPTQAPAPTDGSSQATASPLSTSPSPGTAAPSGDYARCMSSEDARSELPAALKECVNDELERQDRTLNETYRATIAKVPPARQQTLRQEERSWLGQNVSVCRKEAGAQGDIMDDLTYSQCILKRTMERTSQLSFVQ